MAPYNSKIKRQNHPRSHQFFKTNYSLTKLRSLLLVALFYTSLTKGSALQIMKFDVPSLVDPRSETVVLRCDYELEGAELYSVQWYKDGNEFFKFMPSSKPQGLFYDGTNIYVDTKRSDDKKVTLVNTNHRGGTKLAGSYACEVSAEAPNFLTTYAEANISVAVQPKSAPALEGLRSYYEVGDVLKAECTSAPSHPPAVLTFLLNEEVVSKSLIRHLQNDGQPFGKYITTTRQGFTLLLEPQHFPGGSLTLACEATLPGIPIVKALSTKKIVMLSTNNRKLTQEEPNAATSTSTASLLLHSTYLIVLISFLTNAIHSFV